MERQLQRLSKSIPENGRSRCPVKRFTDISHPFFLLFIHLRFEINPSSFDKVPVMNSAQSPYRQKKNALTDLSDQRTRLEYNPINPFELTSAIKFA